MIRDARWRSALREAPRHRAWGVPALLEAALPIDIRRQGPHTPTRAALRGNEAVVGPWLRELGVSERMSSLIVKAEPPKRRPRDHRERMRQRLEQGHLQHRIELWAEADRQYGMECAYPLLDRELLEFVVSVPADQLRWDGLPRSLMRDVLEGRMSEAVRRRTDKTGAVSDHDERWQMWGGIGGAATVG